MYAFDLSLNRSSFLVWGEKTPTASLIKIKTRHILQLMTQSNCKKRSFNEELAFLSRECHNFTAALLISCPMQYE